ncbi:MAG: hypothetical protein EOO89_04945 [Pedobacter sp.]|nr:MAG: hypothetical protein EOO89_04945 [Pedobacter sp.]
MYTYCFARSYVFSMMVYLAELSTPFLNLSFLLKEYHHTTNPLYAMSGLLLVLTFFVVRILLTPYLLYHFVTYWHPTPADKYLYILNVGAILFFFGINYLWFYQIIRIVFKKKGGKTSKKSANRQQDENLTSDGDKID